MTETDKLVSNIRKILPNCNAETFTLANLAMKLGIQVEVLLSAFGDENGLVDAVLNYEQQSLEGIMAPFDTDSMNAIDWLLMASTQINKQFDDISPSITFDLRKEYAGIRQKYIEKRVGFVAGKIRSNFETGIRQGFYRPDLSKELISRIYISRLLDLHNPDYFPNNEINFNTLFEVMFDNFIRGICTSDGIHYYEMKLSEHF